MMRGEILRGRRVIVTRPESAVGGLNEALACAGAVPVSLPLLRIEPVARDNSWITGLERYDNIVFTSANAVSCFVSQLDSVELDAFRKHHGIAVIGPATGKEVDRHGATAAIVATSYVAESLASVLGEVRGRQILWPRAETVRPVLGETLRAGGSDVTELIVYRNVTSIPRGATSVVAGADAVTFMSPSSVSAWGEALGIPSMRVVCIGPITADTARQRGFRVDAVADPYTVDGLLAALRRAFESPGRLS